MPARRKAALDPEARAKADRRNARKIELRQRRRAANETADETCQRLDHKMMDTVICHVLRRARERKRRRTYVAEHLELESQRASAAWAAKKRARKEAPAALNKRGNFVSVANVAAAAVTHIKSMAKTRRRAHDRRPQFRDRINARKRERKATDEQYAVTERLRTRLWDALQRSDATKAASTQKLVGCSQKALRKHLRRKLLGDEQLLDMEVDHVFPMTAYNLKCPREQRKCMHWSNLQPLPKEDNGSKKNQLPTRAMAAHVQRDCWPDGVTTADLPMRLPGWRTPWRM